MLPLRLDHELDVLAEQRAHRDRVRDLEAEMRKHPQIEIKITHNFAHGVYAREAFLPKGSLATGRIHKFSQVNFLMQGEVLVATENGPIHLKAPATIVSPPGTKRAVKALEDSIWTTVIGTHHTDVDTIVAELTVETEEEYARHAGLEFGKLVEIA